MQKKLIISCDFDHTLVVTHKYPDEFDPNIAMINRMKDHRNDGDIIILNTCREGDDLKIAVDYLEREHGLVFDYVNENCKESIELYGDCRKVSADIMYDDKNALVPDLVGSKYSVLGRELR